MNTNKIVIFLNVKRFKSMNSMSIIYDFNLSGFKT